MSLGLIKEESDALCTDFCIKEKIPEDAFNRVDELRSKIIHATGWTKKTEHLKLKALRSMWDAGTWVIRGNFQESNRYVNDANGHLETALNIIAEEWNKGVPDPIDPPNSNNDSSSEWVEYYVEACEDPLLFKDVYSEYEQWMNDNAPDETPLNGISLAKRLGNEGYEKLSKKIDGKTERVWKVRIKADEEL